MPSRRRSSELISSPWTALSAQVGPLELLILCILLTVQTGHPGEADVGNFVLQARGAETLTVPFVCSGGVGHGSQLTAALALGAEGVNCGTLFCATQECSWPSSYKEAMIEATENDTVLLFGNSVAKQAQAIEMEKGKDIQFTDIVDLVAGKRGREAEKNNDKDGGIWSAGQTVGLIHDTPTCQELIDRMVAQAVAAHTRVSSMLQPSSKL
jgi:NADH:quinone reductase (non-electrogenic)